jgi:uncharacterized protein (TIGR00290 family)
MTRVLLSWSSGKDSAWTLHVLRQRNDVEVVGLLTTINASASRVAMHGVRESVLEAQAQAAGLPLWKVPLPAPCPGDEYRRIMRECCIRAVEERVEVIAFGDLFLADIREYRENLLKGTGLKPLFPLWMCPTNELAQHMLTAGVRARVVCVDSKQLDPSFAGRHFDEKFLAQLPASADPCGERGEFHTCVYAGPMFRDPLQLELGRVVDRDGFVFADLALVGRDQSNDRALGSA